MIGLIRSYFNIRALHGPKQVDSLAIEIVCPRRMKLIATILSVFALCSLVTTGYGQDADSLNSESLDAGKVVEQSASSRWYDRDSNDFVLPKVKDEVIYPLRTEGFVAEKANADAKQEALNSQGTAARPWAGWNGVNAEMFSSVILGTLAAILVVAIALLLYHSLKSYVPIHWQRKKKEKKIQIDPARAEDLPFEATQAAYENPLAAAEALYRSGNYNAAIILVYGYMLLVLDQGRFIDLQKGKTNRMYLRELRGVLKLKELLSNAMLGFEDSYFGKISLSKERFESVWESIPSFEQLAASRVSEQAPNAPRVEVVTS